MRLLQEFIRLNVTEIFNLDRQVTMNALRDVVGGPGLSFRVNDQNIYVVDDALLDNTDNGRMGNLSNESLDESNDES